MTTHPRIAIIGGGPGGLTLARILSVKGINTTVFEREAHANIRSQGGTLDLHAESGQHALRQAGLELEFLRIARYDDQGSRLTDKSGDILFADDDAEESDRPEVDRSALRDILLASISPDMVRWDHAVRDIHPNADGTYDVVFAHGSSQTFDLVVGADGTWSKVRPLLSRYEPQYSGLTFIEFGIDDVDEKHPALSALVGRGKLGVESNDSRSLIMQRNANAHLRGYAIFRVPLDWAKKTFNFTSPASARAQLVKELAGWAPKLHDLIWASNDVIVARHIFALPVGHHWQNRAGLTLIGDAAHVMSPYGGEGVNAAMLDAAELARHIAETADWKTAVKNYEEDMFVRIIEPAKGSAEGAATELSHISLETSLEMFQAHMQHRTPADD